MNREQQEMALWRGVFEHWYRRELYELDTCGNVADAAVAEFRKRYPAEPTAPPAVWYDEPPFERNGSHHPCWIQGATGVQIIYWSLLVCGWQCYDPMQSGLTPLNGRRVCPINKPQEPIT